jgi:hypothetical protein
MVLLVLVNFPSTIFGTAYGSAVVPNALGSIVAHGIDDMLRRRTSMDDLVITDDSVAFAVRFDMDFSITVCIFLFPRRW